MKKNGAFNDYANPAHARYRTVYNRQDSSIQQINEIGIKLYGGIMEIYSGKALAEPQDVYNVQVDVNFIRI